jgi:hypothetical protein
MTDETTPPTRGRSPGPLPADGAVREYQGADAERLLKLLGELCCHEVVVDRDVGW